MRVIVETQSRARARLRTRVRRSLVRAFRRLAGVPTRAADNDITVRQVSRVSSVVRSVVPHPLVENAQVRAMATGLIIGSIHVVFAVVNVVLALLARSVWALSVGVVIAALNVGKSYLASGALMSVAIDSSYETEESLLRCRRVGVALVLVVLVMSGTVARLVLQGFGGEYPGVLIYVYAAYALIQILIALVNLVRARREETLAVRGVRAFNLASALISVFALQTVLLSRVDWELLPDTVSRSVVEGGLGGFVCLCMVIMGLRLALTANARLVERRRGDIHYRRRSVR